MDDNRIPQKRALGARPFLHGRSSAPAVARAADYPPITQFLVDEPQPAPGYSAFSYAADQQTAVATREHPGDVEQWEEQDWYGFNWGSAASLASTPAVDERADEAWSTTEWDSSARAGSKPAANSVAAALDSVARRIRAGELAVSADAAITTEAAVAAALAALLRQRR